MRFPQVYYYQRIIHSNGASSQSWKLSFLLMNCERERESMLREKGHELAYPDNNSISEQHRLRHVYWGAVAALGGTLVEREIRRLPTWSNASSLAGFVSLMTAPPMTYTFPTASITGARTTWKAPVERRHSSETNVPTAWKATSVASPSMTTIIPLGWHAGWW